MPPDQRVVKVLQSPKSQHKLCGVSIHFRSVTDAKFEPSEVTLLRLMPSTGGLGGVLCTYISPKGVCDG